MAGKRPSSLTMKEPYFGVDQRFGLRPKTAAEIYIDRPAEFDSKAETN